MITEIKRLTNIKRLNNSINGNPKFQLYFNNEVLTTKSDSMLAYSISSNLINKELEIKYHINKKGKSILDNYKIK